MDFEIIAGIESRNDIEERLRRFFLVAIAPAPTNNHLEQEDRTQGIFNVHVDFEDVGWLTENFVASALSSCPEAQREALIEVFAFLMPTMTIEQQGDLGAVLEEALRVSEIRFPQALADVFYANIPQAAELVNDMELSPTAMTDDFLTAPVYDLPPWFEPTQLGVQEPQPRPAPGFGPEVQGYQQLNETDDWLTDLSTIRNALQRLTAQFLAMVIDGPTYDVFERDYAQAGLDLALRDLELIHLPTRGDISMANLSILRPGLEFAENILLRAFLIIFESGERYLEHEENYLIRSNDMNLRFASYASRFERARVRWLLMYVISHAQTPRLRGITLRRSPLYQPLARDGRDSECVVCHEELPEEGEVATPAVMTYNCCNRSFHADCLLAWVFSIIPATTMTCPMCRTELDLDFLGEVMEIKTLELGVL